MAKTYGVRGHKRSGVKVSAYTRRYNKGGRTLTSKTHMVKWRYKNKRTGESTQGSSRFDNRNIAVKYRNKLIKKGYLAWLSIE